MEFYIGDIVRMRKKHPCGSDLWEITRVGLDFRIRCQKCEHSVMISRVNFEKHVKTIISRGDPELTAKMRPRFKEDVT